MAGSISALFALAASCAADCADLSTLVPDAVVSSEYFEGRWAFADESCDKPTNWTMISGGNFVSEDLTGTWAWDGEKLTLSLLDLAVDEETGEAGGRFQMQGPVVVKGEDEFAMTIEPETYEMKRCLG